MDVVRKDPNVTPEEYLERGEMARVPGGTPRYSLIAGGTCIALGKRLYGSDWPVFDSSVCLDREDVVLCVSGSYSCEGS